MYLRYREPTWDTTAVADEPARVRANGTSGRRRADSLGTAGSKPDLRHASPAPFPSIFLNGVKLHAVTESQVIKHVLDELDQSHGGVVVTPNLDHLRRYCRDLSFGALIAEADLIVADGMPLVWASRLQRTPLPERVPGSTLITSLSVSAGARGRSVFLLGGDPGTAEGAARVLAQRYPAIKIAGTHFPPFGFEKSQKEMGTIIQKLSEARPDIVYVALGSPKQEKLIARLRPILPGAWWIGVGNSFSFLAGHVRRAPMWMQGVGLEWLHRLGQEPRRLFKRYLVVGVPFAATLLGKSALKGAAGRVWRKPALVLANPQIVALARKTPQQLATEEAAIASSVIDVRPSRAATSTGPARGTQAPLSRLRAMVLLGGSVRASALTSCTRRSVLDLPLDDTGSMLNHWLSHARDVSRLASLDRLPVRIMVNQNAMEPTSADPKFYGSFRVERDLSDYRGTGGVLRDLASDYDGEDLILVANAAQVLLEPLTNLAGELVKKGGDVAVVSHEDGTPSGMMLITCKTLKMVPPHGFVDMKEQALPLIASKFDVRVLRYRRPTGLPVRTISDYVHALRFHHLRKNGKLGSTDPLAEDWSPSFSIVESGAMVDGSARVHDSVVLRGARVDSGAVLVRSVVCEGAVVARDRTAVDQLVAASTRSGKASPNRDVILPTAH